MLPALRLPPSSSPPETKGPQASATGNAGSMEDMGSSLWIARCLGWIALLRSVASVASNVDAEDAVEVQPYLLQVADFKVRSGAGWTTLQSHFKPPESTTRTIRNALLETQGTVFNALLLFSTHYSGRSSTSASRGRRRPSTSCARWSRRGRVSST